MYKVIFKEDHVILSPVRAILETWKGKEKVVVVDPDPEWTSKSKYPYPCEVERETVYMETRLQSTLAGRSAFWTFGGEREREEFNQAPYEPVFRGFLENFTWAPPCDREAFRNRMKLIHRRDSLNFLFQGGSEVLNWSGIIKTLPPYTIDHGYQKPLERVEAEFPPYWYLRMFLVDNEKKFQASLTQGNLAIMEAPFKVEGVEELWGGKVIYNHYLAGGKILAQWNKLYLVRMEDGVIISRGHAPIFPLSGLYIAYHPIPSDPSDGRD